MADVFRLHMDSRGRLNIPVELRNKLNLRPGADVQVRLDGHTLVILTPQAVVSKLQEAWNEPDRGH